MNDKIHGQVNLTSKLPQVGTSIFTEMSQLAGKLNALNLSQGFPEFEMPEFLKSAVSEAIEQGKNQYAPSFGVPELLEQITQLVLRQYQLPVTGMENITVTSGATEALFVAIQALVKTGDEVIVFDPAYDCYEPAVNLAGGKCVHLSLNAPDYRVDWQGVAQVINSKTRAIIINSPHNPTGSLLTDDDMLALQQLACEHNLFVISDEVYEFITFDGKTHQSVMRYPELFARSMVISSFGKTFHCTGWKLGYCVAPSALTVEFRKIHQYVTFSSFTPAQVGISKMLQAHPEHIEQLPAFYQQKRDYLVSALQDSQFKILPCHGTYFLLLDYSQISTLSDREFCHWLAAEVGVAAIPLSPFYAEPTTDKVIRLCFAKNEQSLKLAAEKLCQL